MWWTVVVPVFLIAGGALLAVAQVPKLVRRRLSPAQRSNFWTWFHCGMITTGNGVHALVGRTRWYHNPLAWAFYCYVGAVVLWLAIPWVRRLTKQVAAKRRDRPAVRPVGPGGVNRDASGPRTSPSRRLSDREAERTRLETERAQLEAEVDRLRERFDDLQARFERLEHPTQAQQ